MKKQLLFVFILLYSFSAWSQVKIDKQIEIEEADYVFSYNAHPINNNLALFTHEYLGIAGKWMDIHIDHYDSSLQLVKQKKVSYKYDLKDYEMRAISEQFFYVVKYSWAGDFNLIIYDTEKDILKSIQGKVPGSPKILEIGSLGEEVFLVGSSSKGNFIVRVNCQTKKQEDFLIKKDFIDSKALYYLGSRKTENNHALVFYYKSLENKQSSDVYALTYAPESGFRPVVNLTDFTDKFVQGATQKALTETEKITVGTYAEERSYFTEGVFFSKSNAGKIENTLYYPLAGLANFNEVAAKQFIPKGDDNSFYGLTINKPKHLNVVLHDPIILSDGYLLMGEVYYPTSRGNTGYIETYFGGFHYSMSFVMKLDINGKMIWNQVIPLHIYERPFMNRMVNVFYDPPVIPELLITQDNKGNSAIPMAYLSTCKVFSSEINAAGEINKKSELVLETKLLETLDIEVMQSNLFNWGNGHYLAFNYVKPHTKGKRKETQKKNWIVLSRLKIE